MPYMPTNFYPKNCAIDLDSDEITFAADIDVYDTIHEIEIEVFDYYDKESLFAIRIQQQDGAYKTKVTTWERGYVSVVENGETLDCYSYTNYYALHTNRIVLPLKNGERFNFSLPITWHPDSGDELYKKDPFDKSEEKVTEETLLLRSVDANKKYYWTITVIDSSGYSTKLEDHSVWVSDGFVYDKGIVNIANKKTAGVVYVTPSEAINPNIYDIENDTYYRNQVFVHEKKGKAYGFSIRPGTGYYDQDGTANRLGVRKPYDGAKNSNDRKEMWKNEEFREKDNKKLAFFSKVIPIQDHLGDDIFYSSGKVRNENGFQFSIDIYNFKITKIYKECYYVLNKDGSIGALIDPKKLENGYSIRKNGKWYYNNEETETYDYQYGWYDGNTYKLETATLSIQGDIHGPFTAIEYVDDEDLIPLGPVDEKYKDLSGHYLRLVRLWTSIYLFNNTGERHSSVPEDILIDDYYKIMSNYITSFDNYFETVSGLEATITGGTTNLDTILVLNGPARTFTGRFNGDLEWSYWETKLITYEDTNKKTILGEEIVDISEKNYTKQMMYTYFGFKEIAENQRYEVTLYVKDKRNIIVSSLPCKIEKVEMIDLSKKENGISVKTFWNYEKNGVEIDFSQLIGVNGQLYLKGQEVNISNNNFKFKDGTRLAYIDMADYLLYDVLKTSKEYFLNQDGFVFACQGLKDGFSGKVIDVGNFKIEFIPNCNNNQLSPAFKINNYILPLYGEIDNNTGVVRKTSFVESKSVSVFSEDNVIDYSRNYIFDGSNNSNILDTDYLIYGDIFSNNDLIYCYLDRNNFIIKTGEFHWSFYNSNNWSSEFGNIYLYPNLGYKYLYFNTSKVIQDNLLEKFNENSTNFKFKDDIANYTPDWYSFANNDKGILNSLSVFFTNFGDGEYPNPLVTNGIRLSNDSNLYSYEGIVIYRECYDLQDNLLDTLFVNKIQLSKSILYDYSVSNKYKYYYKIIPYYTYENDIRAWSYSGSNEKVQPDYYDVSLFEACNDFNFDKIYYYNPYEKSNGRWNFMLDINADDISYTSETSVTPGSNFAKIAKTNMLYMQGSITAKMGVIRNEIDYIRDNPIEIKKLVNFLSNPGIKMLRLKNGECILVDTQIKSRKNQSQLIGNPTDISFDWYQIEDQDFFFYEIKH